MSDPNKPNICSLLGSVVQNKKLIGAQPCLPRIPPRFYPEQQMRRKAETLKHMSNQSGLTKKGKWSRVAQGQFGGCSPSIPISNASTASDVPGPPMTLVFNPQVPLTHYRKRYIYSQGSSQYIIF